TVMELEKSVFSPIGGQRIDLQEVNDPIFAEGMMGKGTAIIPNDDEVMTAPFDGKISMIAPSKHAVGIISEDGVEILIHVGLDTVKMNGEG
ncbi:PTS glucose transporter subunit IIA, partial [Staphylococcus capitis]